MAENSVKIQQTKNGQYFITLPKFLVKSKRWSKGHELEFVEDEESKRLELRKVL